jgi:hypothetical protein
MSVRPSPEETLSSRFARLAFISLVPLLVLVVGSKTAANVLRNDAASAPHNKEDFMRLAVVGSVAVFMLVRLWLMTARSLSVRVDHIDFNDGDVNAVADVLGDAGREDASIS